MIINICFFLLGWLISKYYRKIKLTIELYQKRKVYFDAMDDMIKTQEFTEKFYKENAIRIPDESDIDGAVYNLEWLQRSPKGGKYFSTPELHALKCEAKLCWRGCTKEDPC
jgi:hypothetical protein